MQIPCSNTFVHYLDTDPSVCARLTKSCPSQVDKRVRNLTAEQRDSIARRSGPRFQACPGDAAGVCPGHCVHFWRYVLWHCVPCGHKGVVSSRMSCHDESACQYCHDKLHWPTPDWFSKNVYRKHRRGRRRVLPSEADAVELDHQEE